MKYKLKQIEFWLHDGINYPQQVNINTFNQLIGKDYDYEELLEIEKELKKFVYNDYKVVSIMNPLYPDLEMTVISCELSADNYFIKDQHKEEVSQGFLAKIKNLLSQHQARLDFIYNSGQGKLSGTRNNGIIYSNDKILYKLEKEINKILKDNYQDFQKIIKSKYHYDLITASQWIEKDDELISIFINKLDSKTEEEINIILRQLIPIVSKLKAKQKKKIYDLIKDRLLLLPSGAIRNKAVSILLETSDLVSDEKLIDYLYLLSNSEQLNYSYPSRQILKQKNNL